MCTVVHISASPVSSRTKRKGDTSSSEQSEDPSLFGEHPPSRGEKKRGDGKQTKANKAMEALPVENVNMGS